MTSLETFYDYFFTYGGYKDYFIGLKNTAIIAVFGLLIGFLIGCLISTVKIVPEKNIPLIIAEKLCDVYIAIFRGTPMTVQLLLLHFAVFPAVGLNITSVAEAVIIFGLNSGAYMAEIIRSGINSIDGGQMEAGRSLGLGFVPTMLFIVLPQAIKNILPTLGNEFIALVKDTSVISFVAAVDLYKTFTEIGNVRYEFLMPYFAMAIMYIVLVMTIAFGVKLLERRLNKNERK